MGTQNSATAGSLESNDILITITATDGDACAVTLNSIVMRQFGAAIIATMEECLRRSGLQGVEVAAQDKGALECTIKARMETAIARFKEKM